MSNKLEKPELPTEQIAISHLKEHPQNYKSHPEDQIAHLKQSIAAYGLYRNIVIAKDNTILAGHGVVEAAKQSGRSFVTAVRLNIDPLSPEALKMLVGDNEISLLANRDDRRLTDLLREINDSSETKLVGTGFDEKMLMGLLMVTRPASEIQDHNAAAEWVGGDLPEYDEGKVFPQLVISFDNEEDRDEFIQQTGVVVTRKGKMNWSTSWPFREQIDASSVRFEVSDDDSGTQEDGIDDDSE